MPKREPPVTTRYTKAGTTPSERVKKPASEISQKPKKKQHTLYSYVKENEHTGIAILELIHQYQEYDCEHRVEEVLAVSSKKLTICCKECHRITYRRRSGVNKSEA